MSASSKPGCLAAFFRLFGIGSKDPSRGSNAMTDDNAKDGADPFPYRLRDDFLSPAEQSFFLVLKNMMGEYFAICTKVSLADIFFVVRPHENRSAHNRISRKHVDFLVCEPKTMQPRFAIELDDSSHKRPDREERDDFVDGVFQAASLPLFHIRVQNAYNTAELGVLFKRALQQVPVTPEKQTLSAQQAPFCPKCGQEMVLRTPKNSERAGKQFYGCRNFPKCREVAAYQA